MFGMRVAVGDQSVDDLLSRPLVEVAAILRETRERRSGLDRRLGSERRQLPPGNPSEQVNLRLFGERRSGVPDRRSGVDRRGFVKRARSGRASLGADPRDGWASPDPRRHGIRARSGRRAVL
jgi:hypothetical protein